MTPGGYSARIYWGDSTALTAGTLSAGISGLHDYATPGDYTIAITVDDGGEVPSPTPSCM